MPGAYCTGDASAPSALQTEHRGPCGPVPAQGPGPAEVKRPRQRKRRGSRLGCADTQSSPGVVGQGVGGGPCPTHLNDGVRHLQCLLGEVQLGLRGWGGAHQVVRSHGFEHPLPLHPFHHSSMTPQTTTCTAPPPSPHKQALTPNNPASHPEPPTHLQRIHSAGDLLQLRLQHLDLRQDAAGQQHGVGDLDPVPTSAALLHLHHPETGFQHRWSCRGGVRGGGGGWQSVRLQN